MHIYIYVCVCVCVCVMVFCFPVSGTVQAIKLVLQFFKYCHSLLQPWQGRSMEDAEGTVHLSIIDF